MGLILGRMQFQESMVARTIGVGRVHYLTSEDGNLVTIVQWILSYDAVRRWLLIDPVCNKLLPWRFGSLSEE